MGGSVEKLQVLLAENARQSRDLYDLVVLPGDQVIGPDTAAVTVIGYCDFACLHCRQAHSLMRRLCARLPHHIRFVYRHFPLIMKHEHAQLAAEASEAAALQDRFWRMNDVLFNNQAHLELDDLYLYAAMAGCDVPTFKEDLLIGAGALKVRRDVLSGQRCGVQGTPTLFMNNMLLSDSDNLEQMVLGQLRKQQT